MVKRLSKRLNADARAELDGHMEHFGKRARAPSIGRWLSGVELTANHAGLLVCMDPLEALLGLEEDPVSRSSLPRAEQGAELMMFTVSQEFARLREAAGLRLPE